MVTNTNNHHVDTTIRVMLGWAKNRLKKQTAKAIAMVAQKPAVTRKKKT